jgi:pimeloyl-ACP methyl ester carboxylesterase
VSAFALIHGGGSSAWDWHLVVPELRERGHDPVAVDLPTGDDSAGWWDYADAAVEAVGDRPDLIVVGHSMGCFTAPLVAARRPVDLLVLLAGMIPAPGESFNDWWTNAGYEDSGYEDVFYHDIPPQLAAEAEARGGVQGNAVLAEPWPLASWPDVPTRYLLCRGDRMFTAEWARRHAPERLGIEADEMDGGHYIALARPAELAERLDAYAVNPQPLSAIRPRRPRPAR